MDSSQQQQQIGGNAVGQTPEQQTFNLQSQSTQSTSSTHNKSEAQKGGTDKKNFLAPAFENPIVKREQFAVNLRKKKTRDLVQAKRLKIMQNVHSKQNQMKDGANQQNIQLINEKQIEEPHSLFTLEEMRTNAYNGYPEWRQDSYNSLQVLLKTIFSDMQLQTYENATTVEKVQTIIQTLQNPQLTPMQHFGLITKIRQCFATGNKDQVSNQHLTQILSQTNLLQIISQILELNNEDGGVDPNGDSIYRYLKLEGTWILINLSYGNEAILTEIFDKKYNVMKHLNSFLDSEDLQMIEQVVWLLANSSAESQKIRCHILAHSYIIDALQKIIIVFQKSGLEFRRSLLNTITYCTMTLCRTEEPQPDQQKDGQINVQSTMTPEERIKIIFIIFKILDTLKIDNISDEETLANGLYTIQSLAEDADDNFIKQLCQATICIELVVSCLRSEKATLYPQAIRIAGSIVSCSAHECIDIFILHGGLDALANQLHPQQNNATMKDVLWTLTNIAAGTAEQQQALISSNDIVQKLVAFLSYDIWAVRREAIFVFTNIFNTTENSDITFGLNYQDDYEIMKLLVKCLEVSAKDREVCQELLQAFDKVLALDKQYTIPQDQQFSYKFEELGGVNILEELQLHKSSEIYNLVKDMIEAHFDADDDGLDDAQPSNAPVRDHNQLNNNGSQQLNQITEVPQQQQFMI